MASLIIRRLFQRSFNQTAFQRLSTSGPIQRHIIQEDGIEFNDI